MNSKMEKIMDNTLVPGRVDIVIFANGGWEKIGWQQSDPEIQPDDILPDILQFVETKQNLPAPEKFTGYFSAKNRSMTVNWMPYAGETEQMRKAREMAFTPVPDPQQIIDIEAPNE